MTLPALRLDSACCRRLNWRTDLPPGLPAETLETPLVAKGWTPRCRHPALRVLRHPEGHEIAWVLPTGRIQLRVDLSISKDERANVARALWEELRSYLASVG